MVINVALQLFVNFSWEKLDARKVLKKKKKKIVKYLIYTITYIEI